MPDPTNHTTNAVAAIAAAATLSWAQIINVDALIGAFAGGIVFVLSSKNYSSIERLCYMMISIVLGYFGGHELVDRGWLSSHTLASFAISAFAVFVSLWVFGLFRDGHITDFIIKRFGGGK